MQTIDFEREISPQGFAGRLILRKAEQLATYPNFSQSDIDDIQQELRMQLFSSMSKFDAEKGDWHAFVKASVERNVASIIERQGAAKRGNGDTPVSLSTKVEGEGGLVALESLVGRWNLEARTGGYSESHTDVIDAAIDIEHILGTLPDDLRELCEQLKTMTITELARKLDMPRSTLRAKLRAVREVMTEAGLNERIVRLPISPLRKPVQVTRV